MALALLPGAALAQATELVNGTPVTVPNSAKDSTRAYTLEVPSGMDKLVVILTGGEGDPDLTVDFETPYAGSECISDALGPEEICEIDSPLPGTWHIEVFGATDYGNGVRLAALAAVELQDGVDETISGADGSINWYFIDVPPDQGHLNVATSGGTGNPNMTVGNDLFGAPECGSGDPGPADSCEIDQPAAGPWLVRISGTAAYTGVTLNAEFGTSRPPGAGLDKNGGAPAPMLLGGLLLAALARRVRDRRAPAP